MNDRINRRNALAAAFSGLAALVIPGHALARKSGSLRLGKTTLIDGSGTMLHSQPPFADLRVLRAKLIERHDRLYDKHMERQATLDQAYLTGRGMHLHSIFPASALALREVIAAIDEMIGERSQLKGTEES